MLRAPGRLLAAPLAPLALLVMVWAAPASVLRVPLAIAAIVWAPGYAALAALHPLGSPTMAPLERTALALGLGLAAVPLVGLALSVAWSLTALHVALAYVALTAALGALAVARGRRAPSTLGIPSPVPAAPSTRATLAICAAALVVSAVLFAVPLLTKAPASAALSLVDARGGLGNLTRDVRPGAPLAFLLQLDAGAAPQAGRLVAVLEGDGPGGASVLLDQPARLAAGQHATVPLAVPGLAPGSYDLVVRWEVPQPRTLHVWLDAGAHAA
ncbi:MAG: hypothetical protein QOI63_1706 [Thermoplasmata archaeon]|jgi:hypothetical protein|nr:hypothetical protein [Thermoplasmata archaeon]